MRHLHQRYANGTIFSLITLTALLSIVNIFSHPLPLKPHTSAGVLLIFGGVFGLFLTAKALAYLKSGSGRLPLQAIDYIVLFLFLGNLLSLIFSPNIHSLIGLRFQSIATLSFFAVRLTKASAAQKRWFLYVLGGLTLFIALVSILYLLFPTLLGYIAYTYFSGKEGYGLVIDYQRGRLLPWGTIILSVPAVYAALVLLAQLRYRYQRHLEVVSFLVLTLAMVISNFRWMFLCFIFISFLFFRLMAFWRTHYFKYIVYGMILFFGAAILGLVLAKTLLGYNLMDRFLLHNPDRDVAHTVGRLYLYSLGLDLFRANMLTGIGTGNYLYFVEPQVYTQYFNIFDQEQRILVPLASHNELITILAETGIIGTLLFIAFIYFSLKKSVALMLRARHHPLHGADRALLATIVCSFTAYILFGLFENINPNNLIYLFILSGIAHSWFET